MYKLGIVQAGKDKIVNSTGKPMNHQWPISLYKHVNVLEENTSNIQGFIQWNLLLDSVLS